MYNPYLIVPFLVWAIAQFLKFSLAALAGRVDFKYLYASGGMPSVHAAVVTSLATTAFLLNGPKSATFGITAILAGIVMYDSFGVRRSAGEQAVAINLILDSMKDDKLGLVHPQARLREILGHKPLEVVAGALLGLVLGGLFNLSKLGPLFTFLSHPVGKNAVYATAVVSAVVIVGAVFRRVTALRKYRGIAVAEEATIRTFWTSVLLGIFGLILAFLQYEKISVALWLVWPFVIIAALAAAVIYFVLRYRVSLPEAVRAHQAQLDKKKWMEGPNKERRKKRERAKRRK